MPSRKKKVKQEVKKTLNRIGLQLRALHSLFGCLALVNVAAMRSSLELVLRDKHLVQPPKMLSPPSSFYNFLKENNVLSDCSLTNEDSVQISENLPLQEWSWAAFCVGYIMANSLSRDIVKKFGSKSILASSILSSAGLAAITPSMLERKSASAVVLLRFFCGLFEGPVYPALNTLLLSWIPVKEKGMLGVFAFSGSQIGSSLMNFLWLKGFNDEIAWKWPFYFFASTSCMWFIGFNTLCSNKPENNYYINLKEKLYIKKKRRSRKLLLRQTKPNWQERFLNPSAWALIRSSIQQDWNETSTIYTIPNYTIKEKLQRSKHKKEMSKLIMNIGTWTTLLCAGYISDILINNKILDDTKTKNLISVLSTFSPNLINALINFYDSQASLKSNKIAQYASNMLLTYYAGMSDQNFLKESSSPLDFSWESILESWTQGVGSLVHGVAPSLDKSEMPVNDFWSFFLLMCSIINPDNQTPEHPSRPFIDFSLSKKVKGNKKRKRG